MKKADKTYWGNLEAISAIAANLILFLLKLWVGTISNSIAVIADAWHTLSDSFSSLIILISLKLSRKPPDKDHPYGHGRIEMISSVVIGTLLAMIGFNFLLESIQRFGTKETANYTLHTIIVIIISIIAKELMAQFAFYCARKSGSDLIKADGWHHRSDALSSLVILAGIFLGKYFWWVDSLLGLIMSLLLFKISYTILRDSISKLLGEQPSDELRSQILDLINSSTSLDVKPHHFHCHNYGEHREISFHIVLDPDLPLSKAHEIAEKIEISIRQEYQIEATIHIDPESTQETKT